MRYKIFVVGLALLTLLFFKASVFAQYHHEEALQKTAGEIYDLIMCPICPGQTIAQSNAETSNQMRDLILKKLRQGETKEEIIQYFENRYGERILAEPKKTGFNMMLWSLPFLFVLLAVIIIYFLIRRWSSKTQGETGTHVGEEAQLGEYKDRLEKELKAFDDGLLGGNLR